MKLTTTVASVALPDFGSEKACPPLPPAVLCARMERVRACMRQRRLEFLAVYADREHCANLAYLTGFDPRFEEAVLLMSAEGRCKLLVGNECQGYLPDVRALGLEVELFQEFSLLGQPRGSSKPLKKILRAFGMGLRPRVGAVGWKYFDGSLLPTRALDVPAYLADVLREICGAPRRVVNAAGIFMNPRDGLRVTNEPEQIAQFEYAAGVSSAGVLALLRHLREGVREDALEKYLDSRGLPLSCHRMVSFGEKAKRGLASPSANRARLGGAFTTALGVAGSLTCRAGVVARSAADLPEETREFYPRLAANYFDVVATWYEHLGIGALAGDIFQAVSRARKRALYDFAVNPGHYIHLDEWLHSPFAAGSTIALGSGMALQMDIIPVSKGPFCCINAEDGVALADEPLRAALQRAYPALWRRVLARRAFMREVLGVRLDDSVLPLSHIPGWLPPYALDLGRVFVRMGA